MRTFRLRQIILGKNMLLLVCLDRRIRLKNYKYRSYLLALTVLFSEIEKNYLFLKWFHFVAK